MVSMFITSALSGRISEPVIMNRAAIVVVIRIAAASGSRSATLFSSSIWLAVSPPTLHLGLGRRAGQVLDVVDQLPVLRRRPLDPGEDVHPDHVLADHRRRRHRDHPGEGLRVVLVLDHPRGRRRVRIRRDPLGDHRVLRVGLELGGELAVDRAGGLLVGEDARVLGRELGPEGGNRERDQDRRRGDRDRPRVAHHPVREAVPATLGVGQRGLLRRALEPGGAKAFTRSPSSASSAGRTSSAAIAQRSAIAIPLIATE